VHIALPPLAVVDILVGIDAFADAVLEIIYPVALVHVARGVLAATLPMQDSVLPFTIVKVTGGTGDLTYAVFFVIEEVSFVDISVFLGELSGTILLSVLPLALVFVP
jgi:hypothetical protein